MSDAMLKVSNLHTYYGESHILHGVDFEIRRGELITLLGRNGAGRTTTLKAMLQSPVIDQDFIDRQKDGGEWNDCSIAMAWLHPRPLRMVL